jgi:hypothetical protein
MRNCLLHFMLFLLALTPWPAVAQSKEESEIKAAMIVSFAQFVEWPAEGRGQLSLCLTGAGALFEALESFHGKRVRQMNIELSWIAGVDKSSKCKILLVDSASMPGFSKWIEASRRRDVLVIADHDGGAQLGAGISFSLRPDGRITFDLNLGALTAAGIRPSARLVELARRVY